MANRKNLANGILALGVNTTDTTWVLQNGYGAGMPAVPFYLTATPFGQLSTIGNSEIVNVTARTTDTLTVERAAKGTTAIAFDAGAVVSNGIYTDDVVNTDSQTVNEDRVLHSFGDSITYGTRSTDPALNAYPVIAAAMKGWGVVNHGVSGARVNDSYVLDEIMAQIIDENSVSTLMIGTNNARIRGMSLAYWDTFRACLMYEAAWLTIPDEFKTRAADLSKTGTWTENAYTTVGNGHGLVTTTAGATLTGSVVGTSIYIGTYATTSTNKSFTVTVDGNAYYTWNSNEHTSFETRQGDLGTFSAYLFRITGLAEGAHSVVITMGDAGGYIDWIAGNGHKRNIDGPNLWLGTIIRATQTYYDNNANYSDAVVALYNTAVSEVVSSLALDGLNICLVDTVAAINNTTDMYDDDDLHPNDGGYAKLAETFFAYMSDFAKIRDRGAGTLRRVPPIKATLGTGFSHYGGAYQDVKFWKDENGVVYVGGSMSTSGISGGSVVLTLPVGYRPARHRNFPTVGNDNHAMTRILSNGQIQYRTGTVSTYYTIDGINFIAEQ